MTERMDRTCLDAAGLEAVFAAMAEAVDKAGSERRAMLLGRLAMLLAGEVGDADRVRACIAMALAGLPAAGE